MFQKKRLLAGALALATCVNLVTVGAFAGNERSTSTQTSSAEETVYVNSYGGTSREVDFNNHWKFNLGNGSQAVEYNDSTWRDVDLPHDYSIEQAYTTSGEAESGYLPGGTGWYRKTFTLDQSWQDKVITINFGGVYMNATVYLNGKELGFHPYGYTAFSLELPRDLLKYDGENVLAVKVDHKTPSSRWYSGSGIYRSVTLTVTDPVHVALNGTYVTTPNLKSSSGSDGTVNIVTTVANDSKDSATVSVKQTIYKNGSDEPVATIAGKEVTVAAGETQNVEQSGKVETPALWSTDDPNLYTVKTEIVKDDQTVDTYTTEFGFRWMEFSNDYGMKLNGKNIKLQGVCMHHDQGALGSEAWYRAIERQIDILKEMGCNAIRVTHNPAADELVEIANHKGMMLIDEAFDTWVLEKNYNSYDYSHTFNTTVGEGNGVLGTTSDMTWAEYDLKAMVNRDKNAPAVIMYSLGNELLEVTQYGGGNYGQIAETLCSYVESIDTTRPITFGDNKLKNNNANAIAIAQVIANHNGLVGYNYSDVGVLDAGAAKNWLVYHSETASAVNSRGVYDRKINADDKGDDYLLTSYDKSKVSWGNVASEAWWRTIQNDNSTGEFVWTGFDYIGEPTPWNGTGTGAQGIWPNSPKSSYFGIIDTNGLPKDSYWFYQSQWNDKVTTLHLLPTWDEDDVAKDGNGNVEVVVYSDAPVVKLYKDGQEIGCAVSTEQDSDGGNYTYRTYSAGTMDSGTNTFVSKSGHESLYATFSVPYGGEKLEVKAFEANGITEITKTEGRDVVQKTTGASKLELSADKESIVADGDDLSYITIDVKDAQGNLVNTDDVTVSLSITGDGKIVGVDNGRQSDHTSYQSTTRKVGAGQLVAIVQSTDKAGSFTVTATADNGVKGDSVTVTTTAKADEGTEDSIVSYNISRYLYVKVGSKPQLPEKVKVNYKSGKTEELTVNWGTYENSLIEKVGTFAISGTLTGTNITVTVNVTMLDQVAALLNYSTTVPVGTETVNLPESRPAVLPNGEILNAEFPVTWDSTDGITGTEGIKKVTGTSEVFGEKLEVTAWVRVAQGTTQYGSNVAANANELTQSIEQKYQSDNLQAIRDGNTAYQKGSDTNPNVWSTYNWSQSGEEGSNQASVEFTYATNQVLGKVVLYYFTDSWSAAKPDEIKLQYSVNGGEYVDFANLQTTEKDMGDSNGAHLYQVTYTFDAASVLKLKVDVTSKAGKPSDEFSSSKATAYCVGLTEVELYPVETSYPVNTTADLDGITVNDKKWSASELSARTYNTEALLVKELDVQTDHNVAYTVLDAYEDVVRILTESEDHSTRQEYTINLNSSSSSDANANDDSRDYDRTKTTASAASQQSAELGADKVVDGNNGTHWHTSWSNGNLSDKPQDRYIQLKLDEPALLDALRYLPRQGNADGEANGRVTGYRVEVSMDGTKWEVVSQGDWANDISWKIALFDQPTQAQYVRLYGVKTVSNQAANAFMSAAEVRVRKAESKTDLSNAVVTLNQTSFDYTGQPIKPEVTSVILEGEELTYGLDYKVEYTENTAPGTGTVTVRGIVDYTGAKSVTFTINAANLEVDTVETVSVVTPQNEQPKLPTTVKVTFTDGTSLSCPVEWDTVDAEKLATVGNVFTVNGTVTLSDGKTSQATATVRVSTGNLARAQENSTLPLAVSSYAPKSDSAVNINDGSKTFSVAQGKKVWSDWEKNTYHDAPWVAIILGEGDEPVATTVDRVSIGFIDETAAVGGDVQANHSVRLPASYQIQVYTGTAALDYDKDNVDQGSTWAVMNDDANWTTVATVTELPSADKYAQMLDTTFKAVKTTAVRVVMTPQNEQWVGVDELEIYGPGEKVLSSDFTVESITADDVDILSKADENNHITLTVKEGDPMPVLAATASDNATVVVTPADDFNGQARIVITSEDGTKTVTYTVSFQVEEEPEPSTEPTQKPEPSTEPTQKPEPSTEPTQKPEPSTEPTQQPGTTEQPVVTQQPGATDQPQTTEKPQDGPAQTGDTANLIPMVAVLVTAAAALMGVVVVARKRRG